MADEILYMGGTALAVFAVIFFLRAVPFILFGNGSRKAPEFAGKLGAYASPAIIACLVVYAYSGLEWRTAAPYIAGALVAALQLAWGNALLSIAAGTALYMAFMHF